MGYVDALLASKISEVQSAFETRREQAMQEVPDFYTVLSEAMAAKTAAASEESDGTSTDAANTQALYAAMAESAAFSSDTQESSLSDYSNIIMQSLSGLSTDDLSAYGLSTTSADYSDVTALYASMLAKQLENSGN